MMSRRSKGDLGFTLLEVLVAAGVLAGFALATARPIQQALMSTAVSADRSAAAFYGMSGLEYARSCTEGDYLTGWVPYSSTLPADARGVALERSIETTSTEMDHGQTALWRVTTKVSWTRDGRRHLGAPEKPLTLVTYQSKWLCRP